MRFFRSLLLGCAVLFGAALQSNAQYCASGASNSADSNVDSVAIAGDATSIANGSVGICATYTDFAGQSADLTPGQSYTIFVGLGTCGGEYVKYCTVYIDWNGDQDYSDADEELGSFSGNSGLYNLTFTVPFSATQGTTRMRVIGQEGGFAANACSNYNWGETEDYDIVVNAPPPFNASIVDISSPIGGCGMSNAETVTTTIANFGSVAISGFLVNYQLDGGAVFSDTVQSTINPGDSLVHTFTTTVDLSTAGTYTLDVYTTLAGDANLSDDTLSTSITSLFTVSTFPYYEDFESSDGDWVTGGANASWQWGAPASGFIPGAASGTNAWVTNLAGNHNNAENSWIESPCIDMSGLTQDPELSFSLIYNTETNYDEAWVDYSLDGGNSWSKLGTSGNGTNWYNDAGNDWWEATSGAAGNWIVASYPLVGFAGQSTVKLRFFFSSDGTVTNDGIGVDDISIQPPPPLDAAMLDVSAPTTGCGLTATESVTVLIENQGTDTIASVDAGYFVNAAAPVTETINTPLAPGATYSHTFAATADLSAPGSYTIVAWTVLGGDADASNDSVVVVVDHLTAVTSFPYLEDFDGTGGQLTQNTNDNLDWTTNAGGTVSTGTGPTGDHTTGAGNYIYIETSLPVSQGDSAIITSPCIDISGMTNPYIDFWYHMNGGGMGTIRLEIFSAGSWTTAWTLSGNQGTAWQLGQFDLSAYAGQVIRYRFTGVAGPTYESDAALDDIVVYNNIPYEDLGAVTLLSPVSDCFLSNAEAVTIQVVNYGNVTINGFDVAYAIDNGAPVTENVTDSIQPGDTLTYQFTGTADLSAVATYPIDFWTILGTDTLVGNDSATAMVDHPGPVSSFPYLEDFDASGGLLTQNTDDVMDWSIISGATTSTGTGPTADHTTGTGNYAYIEASVPASQGDSAIITSPCIDISSMTNPYIEFWYHMWGPNMGTLRLEIFDGTTWTSVWTLSGDQGNQWTLAQFDLSGFSGTIQYRFIGIVGANYESDVSIDDIKVFDNIPFDDLGAVAIINPQSGCNLSSTEPVTVQFINEGNTTIYSFDAGYAVNNGAPVIETVTDSIVPGDTLTYTFAQTADLSVAGYYAIDAWTALGTDTLPANDSTATTIISGDTPVLVTINTNGFGPEVYWNITDSTNSIVVAAGAGYANNSTYTISVCLIQGVTYTFNAFDTFGDGWNGGTYSVTMCNGNLILANNGGAVPNNGTAGGNDLEATEDFTVTTCPIDAAIGNLTSPVSGCNLDSAETITTTIYNNSDQPATDINASFSLNGGPTVSELITDTIAAYDSLVYTFTNTIDLSVGGNYGLDVWIDLAGDNINNNDSLDATISSGDQLVDVIINTVSWGAEVQWELFDSQGNLVGSGSGYTNNNQYVVTLCLVEGETYTFNANDTYGDGWNGGTYEIAGCGGQVILANNGGNVPTNGTNGGGSFQTEVTESFTVNACQTEDIGITAITAPASGCGLSAAETVTVTIESFGSMDMSNFDVHYTINGGTAVTETITSNLTAYGTLTYSFTATGDFSALGTHTIVAWTTFGSDTVTNNDHDTLVIENLQVIDNFPYIQDFENGQDGWTVNGNNASWELGAPTGPFIMAANSGMNAWVTSLGGDYNNNELAYLESPCIDLSSLTTDPLLRFALIYETEVCCDEGWVDYSTDGGLNWTKLGTSGNGSNWYNDAGNDWWDGDSGNIGQWVDAEYPLTGLAGQSNVKLRYVFQSDGSVTADGFGIDDIQIVVPISLDAGVTNIITPVTDTCQWTSTELVTVIIQNFGLNAISGFDVNYSINGGTVVTETITDTLDAGDALTYTFAQSANLSAPNSYNLSTWTSLGGDTILPNDSTSIIINTTTATAPMIDLGADTTVCPGFTITLDAGGNYLSYVWNTNETSTAISVASTGIFWVLVTDTFGCQTIDSIDIELAAGPAVNLGPDVVICPGQSITLNPGIATGTFAWSTGETSPTIVVDSAGTYYVDVEDCGTGSDTIMVSLDTCSGIGALAREPFALSIVPNPSSGQFVLTIEGLDAGPATVSVLSAAGQLVAQEQRFGVAGTTQWQLNYNSLAQGVYFLRVQQADRTVLRKLIVQ